ncbi:MAG: hypothetical protein CM15mP68_3190 [Pseudomonadota bacterium]|nr:MAG: hypothetical protein CM15mP68_3190 [Pseudomonadota bacterium]
MLQPLQIEELIQDIPLEDTVESKFLLTSLRSSEIAQVLEGSRPTTRRVIWQLLEEEDRNQVLQHLGGEVRAEFLEAMDTAQLVAAADDMDTDDFADILQQLPTTISEQVLASLDASDRARVEAVLSFPRTAPAALWTPIPLPCPPDIPWSWCCAICVYAKSCHRVLTLSLW